MPLWSAFVVLLLDALVNGTEVLTAGIISEGGEQVAVVVGQVVEQYLAGCHLVLAATEQHSLMLQHITRQLSSQVGMVVVEAEWLFSQEQPASQEHLLQGLWGEAHHTCRALILHLTNDTLAFSTSAFFLRLAAPCLGFGALVKLPSMLPGQTIYEKQESLKKLVVIGSYTAGSVQ